MTVVDADALDLVIELPDGPPSPPAHDTSSTSAGSKVSSRRDPRAIGRALVLAAPAVLAVLAVWFLLYGLLLSGVEQHVMQSRLYDEFRLQLAGETAPLAEPVQAGSPVAMINAPSAGIYNLIVVEGTTSRLLMSGPGHLSDTPLPGQAGTSVILGRSVTFGAPFGRITQMTVGDVITVTTGEGVFRYRVEDVRRPGSPLPPSLDAGGSRLTLVSSASGGWRSGWAPTHTVCVDALLAGKAQPVPAGVPATVSPASLPMHNDPSATVALIFWLEGLVLVTFAASRAWVRWGRFETWIVGAPVFLAVLWGTSDALMRFLPNLL
ncbi:MAG: class E sortase [Acidimicrobiales bacterium]